MNFINISCLVFELKCVNTRQPKNIPGSKNFSISPSCILLLLYIWRRKFTEWFLAEKNSQNDTLLAKDTRSVYFISVLNLHLRLWDQYETINYSNLQRQ